MANHKGSEGTVKIGTNTVAEIREWQIEEEATQIDDTALGDEWDTHALGRKRWTGSLTCFWDETDTNGQMALTAGASVTLNVYAEGTASSATYYTGTATVGKVTRNASRETMVESAFEFVGTGALSKTTV